MTTNSYCERCQGIGHIKFMITYHGERNEYGEETCPDCKGSGKFLCRWCGKNHEGGPESCP